VTLALESVHAKIDRAEEHTHILKNEVSAWLTDHPYRLVRQVNSDSTRHGLVLRVVRAPNLKRWSLIMGDAVHTLRSAMDHLVYAIARHELGSEPSDKLSKQLMFVIKDQPEDFRAAFWHIASLGPDVRTAIESVQPYHRPHPQLPPLLALLRDLDDSDKHRLLSVILAQAIKGDFSKIRNVRDGERVGFHVYKESLEDGTEVCALTTSSPTPNVTYDFKLKLTVAVKHVAGPNGNKTGLTSLMQFLLPEVRDVIGIVSGAVK